MIKRASRIIHFSLLLIFLTFSPISLSHEMQPGLLDMRQLNVNQYSINWLAPNYFEKAHPSRLQFPESWEMVGDPTARKKGDGVLHSMVITVPDGRIADSSIKFVGLDATITDVFVRIYWLDGTKTTAIVRPNKPWVDIVGQRSSLEVFTDYVVLGIDHILSGFDHLTFVFALLLLVVGWKKLLLTITAFTVAHSITLAMVTLTGFSLPGAPVEAVIALSIIFLARELIVVDQESASLTVKYTWLVAFVFGLLHGFGFAGALSDIGFPENEILVSLLAFNIGVEIGQLFFVAGVLIIIVACKRLNVSLPGWSRKIPAYAIGTVSAVWFIERMYMF